MPTGRRQTSWLLTRVTVRSCTQEYRGEIQEAVTAGLKSRPLDYNSSALTTRQKSIRTVTKKATNIKHFNAATP